MQHYSNSRGDLSDEEFVRGDAQASTTEMVQASSRKIGSLVMMNGQFPCKVTDMKCIKNGKHGAGKCIITAKDIFTGKAFNESFCSTDMIEAPLAKKTEFTCVDIQKGMLSLMGEDLELKEDVSVQGEMEEQIMNIINKAERECRVTVLTWGAKEAAMDVREGDHQ